MKEGQRKRCGSRRERLRRLRRLRRRNLVSVVEESERDEGRRTSLGREVVRSLLLGVLGRSVGLSSDGERLVVLIVEELGHGGIGESASVSSGEVAAKT